MAREHKDVFYAAEFPIEGTGEHMEITLSYHEGGINYFNYNQERRGLYLHMSPVVIDQRPGSGYRSVQRMIGDDRGRKVLVEEMARRNARKGKTMGQAVKAHAEKIARLASEKNWPAVVDLLKEEGIMA